MHNTNQDFRFYDNSGNAVGVVIPSLFHSLVDGHTVINGPAGAYQINEQTVVALEQGLHQAAALVPGAADEVDTVCNLLKNPVTSRTTSFLLCKAKSCADLINDTAAIKSSKVLVIGCGGIGSSVALLLAGAGVEHLTLVDPDIIESSNLNRQLFWRKNDIGNTKVATLQREINDRFDNIKIQSPELEMNYDDIVELLNTGCFSAIAITADNPPTLVSRASDLAVTSGIPVVSGGYLHSHCIANFFSGKDRQHSTLSPDSSTHWLRLPQSIMPSFGPLNFNIAALMASGIITSIASNLFGEQRSHYIEWDAAQWPLGYTTRYFDDNEAGV